MTIVANNTSSRRTLMFLPRAAAALVALSLLVTACTVHAQVPRGYKGKPFRDRYHHDGPQAIPGRVELALYDLGGEGVAYHDTTPTNDGAVSLPPQNVSLSSLV